MYRKRILRVGLAAVLSAALGVSLASCGAGAGASTMEPAAATTASSAEAGALVAENPASSVADAAALNEAVEAEAVPSAATLASSELAAGEVEALYWMREEEKLARDVYRAMFDLWGLPVFENIAASEARHMDAVLGLIEAYGLDDPVVNDTPGLFSNLDLAALYEELTAQGAESVVAALTVGATIEDLDILDLEERLTLTENAGIIRVFENLLRGSRNHLRAFTSLLEAEGVEYEQVYYSAQEIAALLDGVRSGDGQYRGRRSR